MLEKILRGIESLAESVPNTPATDENFMKIIYQLDTYRAEAKMIFRNETGLAIEEVCTRLFNFGLSTELKQALLEYIHVDGKLQNFRKQINIQKTNMKRRF